MIQNKKCTVCKLEKPVLDFNKYVRAKDGYQYACRYCAHRLSKDHYGQYKDVYIKNTGIRTKRKVLQNKLIVYNYLKTHPCVDCNEKDPLVLEFDHITNDKKRDITQIVHRGWAAKSLMDEIAKCEVRCANCHRKKTFLQLGWDKLSNEIKFISLEIDAGNFANLEEIVGKRTVDVIKNWWKNETL